MIAIVMFWILASLLCGSKSWEEMSKNETSVIIICNICGLVIMVSLLRSHQISFKYTMQFETRFSSFFPPVLGMINARVSVYIFFFLCIDSNNDVTFRAQAQAQTLLSMDK